MSFFKAYLGSRSDLDKVPLSSGATYWCIDDGTVHMDHEDDNGILHRTQINAGNSDTLDNKTLEEIQKLIDYNDLLNKPTLGTLAAKSTVAKTDLATDVQTSLGKADTAIQSLAGYAKETYNINNILTFSSVQFSRSFASDSL